MAQDDPLSLLVTQFVNGGYSTQRTLQFIHDEADCIVIPGAKVDDGGIPMPALQSRCEEECNLRAKMTRHEFTIATGGQVGLPQQYHNGFHSEAAFIIRYQMDHHHQPRTKYLEEPFAQDILGNVIFSSQLMLLKGLFRPVFVCQLLDLYRIKIIADHWMGTSTVRPLYWKAKSIAPEKDMERFLTYIDLWVHFKKKGLGHVELFVDSGIQLCSPNWYRNRECLVEGVKWLYENVDDGKRYPKYKVLDELLDELGLT